MQNNSQTNNKRIAKNTLMLYVRMLISMAVGLYTSRVVLQVLGVEDYGLYNVVGGVVAMFTLLSTSISSSISRFITFELGANNHEKLTKVFSTSVIVQIFLSIIILIFLEILGVWFLNTHMNIPHNRIVAANWVFQCSIITFIINLLSLPYNAVIIAHERMTAYAYISILETVLKFAVAISLLFVFYDKLIIYSLLLVGVSIIIRIIYVIYCKRNFEECHYYFFIDKTLIKEMLGFAGWNFFGSCSWVFNTHGINVLINIFFSLTINAARGIAGQMEGVVSQFANNIMMALTPQITKSYASNNLSYMRFLIYQGARYSHILLLFLVIPICVETEQILSLWLSTVPPYTETFVRLSMIATVCSTLGNLLSTAQLATGDVKLFQIVTSCIGLLVFPFSWLAFSLGYSPVSFYIIYILLYFFILLVKAHIIKNKIKEFSIIQYFNQAILRPICVSVCTIVVSLPLHFLLPPTFFRLLLVFSLTFITTSFFGFLIGLNHQEKQKVQNIIIERYIKKRL